MSIGAFPIGSHPIGAPPPLVPLIIVPDPPEPPDYRFGRLTQPATRPIYVIRWEHSGTTELISCSGDITFNEEFYTPAGVAVLDLSDGLSATIELIPDAARVSEVIGGNWRNGKTCKIYAIPGVPGSEKYYTLEEAFLVMDGVIEDSELSGGRITVTVRHKYIGRNLTPRYNCSEVSTILPAAGTVLEVGGTKYVLQAPR